MIQYSTEIETVKLYENDNFTCYLSFVFFCFLGQSIGKNMMPPKFNMFLNRYHITVYMTVLKFITFIFTESIVIPLSIIITMYLLKNTGHQAPRIQLK